MMEVEGRQSKRQEPGGDTSYLGFMIMGGGTSEDEM